MLPSCYVHVTFMLPLHVTLMLPSCYPHATFMLPSCYLHVTLMSLMLQMTCVNKLISKHFLRNVRHKTHLMYNITTNDVPQRAELREGNALTSHIPHNLPLPPHTSTHFLNASNSSSTSSPAPIPVVAPSLSSESWALNGIIGTGGSRCKILWSEGLSV